MIGILVVVIVTLVLVAAVVGPYAVRWPGMPEKLSTYYGWVFLALIALIALGLLLPVGLFGGN